MARRRRHQQRSLLAPLGILTVLVAVVVVLGAVVWHLLTGRQVLMIPPSEQCIVTVGATTASLDPDQSVNAAIIVAESLRRGLPPRAASIALATAMQESGLHNLDHGDRDSVGLFQQRPSQGWGTAANLMDPWYASGKFYDALVKVVNWQTGDINNVAQAVQHSGVPNGYQKHVEAARAFASALTGYSPAAVSCVSRATRPGSTGALATFLHRGFPSLHTAGSGSTLEVTTTDQHTQWAIAQLAMMSTGSYGVDAVTVGQRSWHNDGKHVATWATATTPAAGVRITVRG